MALLQETAESVRESVCVCMTERERERECVCVYDRERECLCVCQLIRKTHTHTHKRVRERERVYDRECVYDRERECVCVFARVSGSLNDMLAVLQKEPPHTSSVAVAIPFFTFLHNTEILSPPITTSSQSLSMMVIE